MADCKLKELFLVEKLPKGAMAIYDCDSDNFALVAKKDGSIEEVHKNRFVLDMMDLSQLNDKLLYDIIEKAAESNFLYKPNQIELAYALRDLGTPAWMMVPNDSINLETVFGDAYYIANVMETDMAKIKSITCEYISDGEVLFLPEVAYFSRIALDDNGNFGVGIFNPKSILKCSYDSKVK